MPANALSTEAAAGGFWATLQHAWRSWWSVSWADGDRVPWWAHALVTLLFSLAVAAGITASAWVFSGGRLELVRTLAANTVVALCIGFAIHLLFALAGGLLGAQRLDAMRAGRRGLLFTLLALLGVAVGYALGLALLEWLRLVESAIDRLDSRLVFGTLLVWLVISAIYWRSYRASVRLLESERARDALAAAARESDALAAQMMQARLSALQAQIEPHFLFNTLANIASLVESEPARAKAMLDRLGTLLRAVLAASRAPHTTLGQELDLVRAYLEIMEMRMGGRLRFSIDADAPLRAHPVPPLLLQPLVENAIRHGLEPKAAPGQVRIRARASADGVDLAVEDDGVGFDATTAGDGVGLANLRERLRALYGEAARLTIEEARPGTRVRLHLPLAASARA
ncbi:MAG: histidine kinase [Burkholderiaceae bacterium]|nr:histidine kinase [Burkholderiaceae bacterium]